MKSKFATIAYHAIVCVLGLILCYGCAPTGAVREDARTSEEKEFDIAKKQKTVQAFEAFLQTYPQSRFNKEAYLGIAHCCTASKDWDWAIAAYRRLMAGFPEDSVKTKKIIQLLQAPEDTVVVKNLGANINTQYNEYAPVVSADGQTLYFCSNDLDRLLETKEKIDLAEYLANPKEEIWYSEREGEGWSKAKKVGSPLNSMKNDALEAISVDKTMVFIFRSGNIMTSRIGADGKWEEPQDIGPPINSGSWDADVCFSSNGQVLLFASKRPGGFRSEHDGETTSDIYVSVRNGNPWGKPINLGPTINTIGTERSPFLASDGKTLYFSSDGHPGLGGLDVFRSVSKGDSWTEWSEPENLGKGINTPEGDWGYKIPASGDVAYYGISGRPDGYGGEDVYVIELPKKVQPAAVTAIKGTIKDRKGNPLAAKVRWENLETGEKAGEAQSNPVTGEYYIALPAGKNYGYYAEKRGYYPASQNIDLRGKEKYAEYTVDVILTTGEVEPIVLQNVFFDFNKADLKPESYPELNRLVDFLQQNPGKRVEIAGHTDDVGTDAYNQNLSERRAKAVVEYLVSKGISKMKLDAKGYGKRVPVDTTATEEGRAKNRRVEFKFVK